MLTKDLETFICKSYTRVNVPNDFAYDTATKRSTCDHNRNNSHVYRKCIYMKELESKRFSHEDKNMICI